MVQKPPCNADDGDLIPGQGTKIPHAVEQLSPHAGTTETPTCSEARTPQNLGTAAKDPVQCNDDPRVQRNPRQSNKLDIKKKKRPSTQ